MVSVFVWLICSTTSLWQRITKKQLWTRKDLEICDVTKYQALSDYSSSSQLTHYHSNLGHNVSSVYWHAKDHLLKQWRIQNTYHHWPQTGKFWGLYFQMSKLLYMITVIRNFGLVIGLAIKSSQVRLLIGAQLWASCSRPMSVTKQYNLVPLLKKTKSSRKKAHVHK